MQDKISKNPDNESCFFCCTDGDEVQANFVFPDNNAEDIIMALAATFKKVPMYEFLIRAALDVKQQVKDDRIVLTEHKRFS